VIVDCLKRANLSVAPHSNYTAWKPGMVQNVGGLKECLRSKGHHVLRDACKVLARAYDGPMLRYAGTIFGWHRAHRRERAPGLRERVRLFECREQNSCPA
jgi:hypothetical protein